MFLCEYRKNCIFCQTEDSVVGVATFLAHTVTTKNNPFGGLIFSTHKIHFFFVSAQKGYSVLLERTGCVSV